MILKLSTLLAVALSGGALLAGCGSSESKPTPTSTAPVRPATGPVVPPKPQVAVANCKQAIQASRLDQTRSLRKRPRLEHHIRHLVSQLRLHFLKPNLRCLHRLQVAIKANQLAFAAQPLRNLRRVPRKPKRRITDHAARTYIQILQNFL